MDDIVSEIRSDTTEVLLRDAIQTVVDAERNDEELRDKGSVKNTHFEFMFGASKTEEVYVYFERLHHDTGFEVLVWADEGYFRDVTDERPEVSDGGEQFEEFVEVLFEYVVDEAGIDQSANPSFHTNAPPSVVFADHFYL